MAQLQKGTTYTGTGASSFVTHTNLNAHVDNARLVGGAIGEQTANSSSSDSDLLLVNKGGDLFKQTKGEFTNVINSNISNINTVNAELVDADSVETINATITGNLSIGGNSALTGSLAVTGATTLNSLTVAGKTPVYVGDSFYKESIKKVTFPAFLSFTQDIWASPPITVPADETWIYEIHCHMAADNNGGNTRPEPVMNLFLDVGTRNLDTMVLTFGAFGSPFGGYVGVGKITSSDTPTPQVVKLRVTPNNSRSGWNPLYSSLVVRLVRQKTADLQNDNLYI